MATFLFPCDFLNSKKVDSNFEDEYNTFKKVGFSTSLINLDTEEKLTTQNLYEKFIYRGWMLTKESYEKLNKRCNNSLLINTQDYLHSHHLPNWYHEISEYTIPSVITTEENAISTFSDLLWQEAFIKDFVKSINSSKGSFIYSADDVNIALKLIKQHRGFIEGGIVFRKIINIQKNSETRFFVFNSKVFSNSNNINMISFAEKVAKLHNSLFFSLDIAIDDNNDYVVIEIGDGQVSEAKQWDLENFVNIFKEYK